MLDVGAGTGCLIPSLLRVAGSEQQRRKREREGKKAREEILASLPSATLPMDYLAVDVSAGMLKALERIHGGRNGGGGEEKEEEEEEEEKEADDVDKNSSTSPSPPLLGNLPSIRTWLGDIESVPPFQAPFDACFFNAVFGNVFDQRSSLLAAALLLRPGKGRIVVAHPMGRGWHDRLRAADTEIVPHALPEDAEKWAELLRGLPLELVEVVERKVEGEAEEGEATTTERGGENSKGSSASTSTSSSSSSSPSSSSRRLVADDEDCYIAALRVPPAWRLPASLYGSGAAASSPAAAAASSPAAAAFAAGDDYNEQDKGTGNSSSLLPQLVFPQLLPRLPWEQGKEEEEKEKEEDRNSPLPPLLLGGTVVKGFGRGSSKMGIPTANIDPLPLEEVLAGVPDGVYLGWARLLPESEEEGGEGGEEETTTEKLKTRNDHQAHKCVLNIGRRPTFDGEKKGVGVLSIEVHVLHTFVGGENGGEGRDGELLNFCGQELRVAATGFLRPEMRYSGIAALVSRIRSDVATASAALDEREHSWAKGHGYLWRKE